MVSIIGAGNSSNSRGIMVIPQEGNNISSNNHSNSSKTGIETLLNSKIGTEIFHNSKTTMNSPTLDTKTSKITKDSNSDNLSNKDSETTTMEGSQINLYTQIDLK